MKFEWVKSTDDFGTETVQLLRGKTVFVEIVKYPNEETCEIFGELWDIMPELTGYHETIADAKDHVGDMLHEFCVEFNTWYQRWD